MQRVIRDDGKVVGEKSHHGAYSQYRRSWKLKPQEAATYGE